MSNPLDAVDWPVRTDRLLLRTASPEDVRAIWRYRRLPDVSRWITRAPARYEEFEAHTSTPQRLGETVIVEHDREVIGDLMLKVVDGWGQAEVADRTTGVQAELGWVVDPAYHGYGYATEAVAELLRLCFEVLGLRRVTAGCFAANEPSWRLMERLGMRREAYTVKDSLHRTEGWLDSMEYAILAEEWLTRPHRASTV